MKKAVVFDLDGTLTIGEFLDKEAYYRYKLRLYQSLVEFDSRLREVISSDNFLYQMRLLAREFFREDPVKRKRVTEIVDKIIDEYGAYSQKFFKPDPAAEKVVRKLKEKSIKVAVCTYSSRKIAYKVLRELGVLKLLDVISCRDDVEYPKPDPRHLLEVLNLLKVSPEAALYVGDSLFDVECARAAGVDIVVIVRDESKKNAFKNVPIVKSLSEILDVVTADP
ncbi:MAG TPA: HAD family hydrolase [Thermoprotei archaeon]|nr:HAD family hydrolase [Thermoprotei archaeon]